jgi:hypothetical protein
MKTTHNLKVGDVKTFKHFGELDAFAAKNKYKKGEFQFIGDTGLTIKKVK